MMGLPTSSNPLKNGRSAKNSRPLTAGVVLVLVAAALMAGLLGARSCGAETTSLPDETLASLPDESLPTVLGDPLTTTPDATSGGPTATAPAGAGDHEGVVPQSAVEATLLDVIDGDTIRVRMADGSEEKVRYIGIDAPEVAHPDSAGEYLGDEATAHNEELLAAGPLYLETDVDPWDDFGRMLAYVWAGDDFINERMVADGYARAHNYPPNLTRQEQLWDAHDAAREAGIGIWGESRE